MRSQGCQRRALVSCRELDQVASDSSEDSAICAQEARGSADDGVKARLRVGGRTSHGLLYLGGGCLLLVRLRFAL
jgi:hypothetical protein